MPRNTDATNAPVADVSRNPLHCTCTHLSGNEHDFPCSPQVANFLRHSRPRETLESKRTQGLAPLPRNAHRYDEGRLIFKSTPSVFTLSLEHLFPRQSAITVCLSCQLSQRSDARYIICATRTTTFHIPRHQLPVVLRCIKPVHVSCNSSGQDQIVQRHSTIK